LIVCSTEKTPTGLFPHSPFVSAPQLGGLVSLSMLSNVPLKMMPDLDSISSGVSGPQVQAQAGPAAIRMASNRNAPGIHRPVRRVALACLSTMALGSRQRSLISLFS
jgi:hypothetical protein